jgi:hypothetical protein
MHAPCALAAALHAGAERAHRIAGVDHILAFEQTGNLRFPDRERAEDERAVRYRLVARHPHAARDRAGAARGERGRGGVIHGQISGAAAKARCLA